MWLSSFGAAVVLLVFSLATGLPLAGFTLDQYAALVALGLISHVAGWLCINYALGHLRASLTSVSLLAQPVITAISVPLLGEALSAAQIVGGGLVLAGIYLANRRSAPRPRRTHRRRRANPPPDRDRAAGGIIRAARRCLILPGALARPDLSG